MAFDFPNSPTIGQIAYGYTWDGEKWLSPFTAPNTFGAVKKNYVINGGMQIAQEQPQGFNYNLGTGQSYPVDMFAVNANGTTGVATITQAVSRTPGGSQNRLRITVITADAAVAAADFYRIIQAVEGYRWADMKYGTTDAKTSTLQFGCRGPAGHYCVLCQGGVSRS
jgi:hypothetical protein